MDGVIGNGAGDDGGPLFGAIDGVPEDGDCDCDVGWDGDDFFGDCCWYYYYYYFIIILLLLIINIIMLFGIVGVIGIK